MSMKIELNLADIMTDEDGTPSESLGESLRRQVVQQAVQAIREDAAAQLEAAIAEAIQQQVKTTLAEMLPPMMEALLDKTYTPVGDYGRLGQPTTIRATLEAELQRMAVYKRAAYDSDKTPFSRAVDDAVAKKLAEFRTEWVRTVDNRFLAEAMGYAAEQFAKRAGIELKQSR